MLCAATQNYGRGVPLIGDDMFVVLGEDARREEQYTGYIHDNNIMISNTLTVEKRNSPIVIYIYLDI